jgi:hypothetical protein
VIHEREISMHLKMADHPVVCAEQRTVQEG